MRRTPRPRWWQLYSSVALLSAAAIAGDHFLTMRPILMHIADGVFGASVIVVLAAWLHLNRVRLALLAEPDDRTGRPRRRRRRSANDHVVIPWDFT